MFLIPARPTCGFVVKVFTVIKTATSKTFFPVWILIEVGQLIPPRRAGTCSVLRTWRERLARAPVRIGNAAIHRVIIDNNAGIYLIYPGCLTLFAPFKVVIFDLDVGTSCSAASVANN